MSGKQTLSTFFIIKHEVLTIERALDSVLGVTDEYVIGIDDKSRDGTREVVQKWVKEHPDEEVILYDFTWENHFAKARNEAMSRCTKDWIFQLDGHEYLHSDSKKALLYYINALPEDITLISARMHLEPSFHGQSEGVSIPEIWFMQSHIFRNHQGIEYEYASHNQVTSKTCPMSARLSTPEIVIVHDRPKSNEIERREQRAEMNMPFFKEELKRDRKSERGLFYLMMSYIDHSAVGEDERGQKIYDHKKLRKACRCGEVYLRHYGDTMPEQAFEAATKIGEAYDEMGMHDDAYRCYIEGVKLQPQRAESYYNIGMHTRNRIDMLRDEYSDENGQLVSDRAQRAEYLTKLKMTLDETEGWLEIASRKIPPVTNYYMKASVYMFMPHLQLATLNSNIFAFTGKPEYYDKAMAYYAKVQRVLPDNIGVEAEKNHLKAMAVEFRSKALAHDGRKTIAILNSTGQFSEHLMERWASDYDVKQWERASLDAALWADVSFCAWCDQNAITLSKEGISPNLWVRLNRYEAYGNMPKQVDWRNVRGLIVNSESMKQYVTDSFDISCPVHVVYHGVDLENYTYKERAHGKNVAVISFIHSRKDYAALADVIIDSPNHVFHIAGQVQQQDLWRYFWWKLRKHGAEGRAVFHGWQQNVDEWLEKIDANYLLSMSWSESFGYGIAEAMACGVKPIIRDFECADEIWPTELIVGSHDAVLMALNGGDYNSKKYRAWIEKRYNADREAADLIKLFFGEANANEQS